ncbi:MAG: hypothetical protein WCW31_05870 [Patescibacteria group bacterium]|jgi:hypothetical protein
MSFEKKLEKDEKLMKRGVLWIVFGLMVILGLTWVIQGNDFFLYKVFAPKYEAARRETFEQSKAYNQGTIQELQRMRFEYVKAAPEQKAALASVILHQVADFDENRLPPNLKDFINQLKRERETAK